MDIHHPLLLQDNRIRIDTIDKRVGLARLIRGVHGKSSHFRDPLSVYFSDGRAEHHRKVNSRFLGLHHASKQLAARFLYLQS